MTSLHLLQDCVTRLASVPNKNDDKNLFDCWKHSLAVKMHCGNVCCCQSISSQHLRLSIDVQLAVVDFVNIVDGINVQKTLYRKHPAKESEGKLFTEMFAVTRNVLVNS